MDENASICIVLDAPLEGHASKLFWFGLNRLGLYESNTHIHYILDERIDITDVKKASERYGKKILDSITRLGELCSVHQFNAILACGKLGLYNLCDGANVSEWRGSVLTCMGRKLIATYSPFSLALEESLFPIFCFDVNKAVQESKTKEIEYPVIDYKIDPKDDSILTSLLQQEYLSCDIETTRGEDKELLCIGFGYKDIAIVLPFTKYNDPYIRNVLASSSVKKIFHHGAFDVNVLMMKGYEVNGYEEDTIIQAQILEPELPRSLGFLTSIYTKLPYYKSEGRSQIPEDDKSWKSSRSREELFIYNAKDVWVTYKIWEEQTKELKDLNLYDLYRYAIKSNHAAITLSQNGLLLDTNYQEEMRKVVKEKIVESYTILARLTGFVINPRSSKDVPALLYDKLKLPIKKNRAGKPTTDEDALVSLIGYCKNQIAKYKSEDKQYEWNRNLLILQVIIHLRGLEKLMSSYINIKSSPDGRVRSLYKVHATETGRWAASKFIDDTGINLQTVPRGGI